MLARLLTLVLVCNCSATSNAPLDGDLPIGGPTFERLAIGPSSGLFTIAGLGDSELYAAGGSTTLRSIDQGETWSTPSVEFRSEFMFRFTLCPTADGVRIADRGGTLYWSADGTRWEAADMGALFTGESFPTADLACDDAGAVYAARPSFRPGADHTIAISNDRGRSYARGRTWALPGRHPMGLIAPSRTGLVVTGQGELCTMTGAFSCAPGVPLGDLLVDRVFRVNGSTFVTARDPDQRLRRLYRSDDRGATWHLVWEHTPGESAAVIGFGGTGLYRLTAAANDPEATAVDWSVDGATWEPLLQAPGVAAVWRTPGGSVFAVAIDGSLYRRVAP